MGSGGFAAAWWLGDGASVTRSGLRGPGSHAALGAVETRLPDDALTLLNRAATHSSRVPSLPNSRLSAAGLSLLEHFSFTGCWVMVNVYRVSARRGSQRFAFFASEIYSISTAL